VWGAFRFGGSVFRLCAQGVETKAAAAEIDGHAREAGECEARKSRAGRERSEDTFEMAEVMDPAVVDLKSEECAAGAQHAENFAEGEVLQFAGLEMVEDENGNGRRESFTRERQMRGIAADNSAGIRVVVGFQLARGIVVVLQRGDSRNAFAKMHGGGAITGANLQEMIAQVRIGQEPGKQLALGNIPPQRGRADAVFQGVHKVRGRENV
jgi:hypothetical protein